MSKAVRMMCAAVLATAAPAIAQGVRILQPIDTTGRPVFGFPVAGVADLDGDKYPDVLVGANQEYDPNDPRIRGAVYVFSGRSGSLVRVTRAPTPVEFSTTGFGESAAGFVDLNTDGFTEYVCGAYVEGLGRAYVFSGRDGSIVQALDPPGDYWPFGNELLAVGDLDGDGAGDLLVSATFTFGGRVFAFSGATGGPIHMFSPPPSPTPSSFGMTLAEVPDQNADGISDLAIGAERWLGGWEGVVHLCSGATGEILWSQAPPSPTSFGWSIAVIANADCQGTPTIAVGAPFDRSSDDKSFRPGLIYLLRANDGAFVGTIESPSPQNDGVFGYALASIGDLDADGIDDLLVGAHGEAAPGLTRNGGRAYVMSGANGSVLRFIASPTPFAPANFGGALDAAGDIDGDGRSDWIVGAPGDCDGCNPNSPGAGRAYIFYSCRADWNMSASVTSQDFFDFLADWFAGAADFNVDGHSDSRDFFDYLREFFSGCDYK